MMAKKRKDDGTSAKDTNFSYYKDARQTLFDALDDETQAEYEDKAIKENLALKVPPDRDIIYEYVSALLDGGRFLTV